MVARSSGPGCWPWRRLSPASPAATRPSPGRLLVATSWPAIDRRRLESEFQSWVAASHGHLEHRRIRLEWLILEPGDDLVRLVAAQGTTGCLARRQRLVVRSPGAGQLGRSTAGSALWCAIRLAIGRRVSAMPSLGSRAGRRAGTIASRSAPIPGLGDSQLDHGHWREGYARLVRAAGSRPRISLSAGGAVDAPSPRRGGAGRDLASNPVPAPADRVRGDSPDGPESGRGSGFLAISGRDAARRAGPGPGRDRGRR